MPRGRTCSRHVGFAPGSHRSAGHVGFDEVDAGIGGEAAVAVAKALGDLGERHQVLVVTHLAHVAATAAHHVKVTKTVRSKQTFAQASPLEHDERVAEIARMLSGGVAEASALKHAQELLTTTLARTEGSQQPDGSELAGILIFRHRDKNVKRCDGSQEMPKLFS